jgi:hypothetical protein
LVPPLGSTSTARASVAVNSLGLIDNLQIAASGLNPGKKYRLVLTGRSASEDLIRFSAGIGGVAVVQTLGPLKHVVSGSQTVTELTLEVRSDETGADSLVLRQARPAVITK